MATATYKLKGAEQILATLRTLPSKVSKRIFRKALRAGAKIVLAAAKKNAPVRTGRLRRSLKVRAGKARKNRLSMLVNTRQGDYAGDEFYGAFQEYGWRLGRRKLGNKRKQIAGRHYIEKAFDSTKSKATDTVIDNLKSGIETEARAA